MDDGPALSVRSGVVRHVPGVAGRRRRLLRAPLARQRHESGAGKRRRSGRGRSGSEVHQTESQLDLHAT